MLLQKQLKCTEIFEIEFANIKLGGLVAEIFLAYFLVLALAVSGVSRAIL